MKKIFFLSILLASSISFTQRYPTPSVGAGVSSVNSITGNVNIVAGPGISVVTASPNITISSLLDFNTPGSFAGFDPTSGALTTVPAWTFDTVGQVTSQIASVDSPYMTSLYLGASITTTLTSYTGVVVAPFMSSSETQSFDYGGSFYSQAEFASGFICPGTINGYADITSVDAGAEIAYYEVFNAAATFSGIIDNRIDALIDENTMNSGSTVTNYNSSELRPTLNGTISNRYDAIEVVPTGSGSINKAYVLKADFRGLSPYPTHPWGIYIPDPGLDNWLAKDVVIGGSTGTSTYGFDITGNSIFKGYIDQAGESAPAVSNSGQGRIYFDSGSHIFMASQNGAAYVPLIGGAGGGSVTTVSVVTANGFSGTVANNTTTPAITLTGTLTGDVTGAINSNSLTATTNGTLVTLTALSLPGSQVSSAVANATAAVTSTNLAGGSAGVLPYQSAVNTTLFTAVGTSGQCLISSGAGAPMWGSCASGGTIGIANGGTGATTVSGARTNLGIGAGSVLLTSGTTWTSPSSITTSTQFKITVIGGGGGGAGNSGANNQNSGSGGGGGAACVLSMSGLSPSTSYSILIGSGGSGGTPGNQGGNGSASQFEYNISTICEANGGQGGNTGGGELGGSGGTSSGGTININGQTGGSSALASTTLSTFPSPSGAGGSSGLGFGAGASETVSTSGRNGSLYGGGGSGAYGIYGSGGNTGGAGAQGVIFIEWWN